MAAVLSSNSDSSFPRFSFCNIQLLHSHKHIHSFISPPPSSWAGGPSSPSWACRWCSWCGCCPRWSSLAKPGARPSHSQRYSGLLAFKWHICFICSDIYKIATHFNSKSSSSWLFLSRTMETICFSIFITWFLRGLKSNYNLNTNID